MYSHADRLRVVELNIRLSWASGLDATICQLGYPKRVIARNAACEGFFSRLKIDLFYPCD